MRDALPNASYIGFKGTPIEKTDANTRAVFGDYISIYDIQRAVPEKATVPIYYESRIAKLGLRQNVAAKMSDEAFLSDAPTLLRPGVAYEASKAYALVEPELLMQL